MCGKPFAYEGNLLPEGRTRMALTEDAERLQQTHGARWDPTIASEGILPKETLSWRSSHKVLPI